MVKSTGHNRHANQPLRWDIWSYLLGGGQWR
ncbi:hypothetical protein BHE75_00608 [Sphingomonas haloaromaticamans]|uniref:Uncharacterized protein n=1 Tax=Edaphosphingomonas haloaromaticamans TaxID=653954 RepID=A0A1S1H933_9SPHN|nr:hypothetical protein BHE75_00608 [Sphingomonas haloaromaticamans]